MRLRPFELLLQLAFPELNYVRILMGGVKKPIYVLFKFY